MNREEFKEELLLVMEAKAHPRWQAFTSGKVPKEKLHIHFEQEYETYVRDFPIMVGWAYVQCPIAAVRRELAENLYEEETGGLSKGRPHPELFLEYPRGLGMDLKRFDAVVLLPAAQAYREGLDEATQNKGWEAAVAVATLFVEGTQYERGEIDAQAPKRPVSPLDKHPLVVHYGLPLDALALTKVHRAVEGDHRKAAWDMILNHIGQDARPAVVKVMHDTLNKWLRYRDAVCDACGV